MRVKNLTVAGLYLDYVHTPQTAAAETARKEKVKAAAKDAGDKGVVLKLDKFDVVRSNIGFVNKTKNPPYRLYFADANGHVSNLSNQFSQGPAVATLRGRFMGKGPSVATFHYRPNKSGPDFDLDLAIEDTEMTAMNDILRAYGKFDVTAGTFSFYSQLRVKNGQMNGYVKPLFSGMKVYDPEQDKQKSVFHKLYEMIVGGVANLSRTRRRRTSRRRPTSPGRSAAQRRAPGRSSAASSRTPSSRRSSPASRSRSSGSAASADRRTVICAFMAPRSPLEKAPDTLAAGRVVYFKREDRHALGAFKWRGALPAVEAFRARGAAGIVTASTGNHGSAAAWAARQRRTCPRSSTRRSGRRGRSSP